MRRVWLGLVTAMVATLLCCLLAPGAHGATRTIRLDGVLVRLDPSSTQAITVNRTRGFHARIVFWQQRADGWHRVVGSKAGRIGYGGLVDPLRRKQGTGTTPLGTYPLPFSFGTGPRRAGWALAYVRVHRNDYWVEDNRSRFYNRMRNKAAGGFRWWLDPRSEDGSERLASYPVQYAMSVVIGFNYDRPVRHRGAGIFLHVNGRGATAGCVSAPRAFLARTLRLLDPAQHPVIAIGR